MTALEILTTDEIKLITGSPTRKIQVGWFVDRGWPHETNHFGFPVVLRSVALERLGALPEADPWNLNEADVA